MYLGVLLQCPIILFDFNETGIFLIDLNKDPQCNISQTSARWETSCSMRPDGLDRGNNYVSYICGRAEQYKIERIVALPWKQFLYSSLVLLQKLLKQTGAIDSSIKWSSKA